MYESMSQPRTPAPAPAPVADAGNLRSIIARLNAYLEAETQGIGDDSNFDFRQSSERKSRMLFELNRASRSVQITQLDQHSRAELGRLKRALLQNEAKIKAHLYAVREVSDLMVSLIRNEEADGTYGQYSY